MKNNEELKQLIETSCDKLKKELLSKIEATPTVGKWYKSTTDKALYYIEKLGPNNEVKNYGFGYNGEWMNLETRYFAGEQKTDIEATASEVETALINEAKKRGFKEGVKFKGIGDEVNEYTFKDFWFNGNDRNMVWSSNNGIIFRDGVWSTPIPTEKTSKEWADVFDTKEYKRMTLHNFLVINSLKIVKK